jgi:hypothetical protein
MKWLLLTAGLMFIAAVAWGEARAASHGEAEGSQEIVPAPAAATDRHAGYYYPKPSSVHVYSARSRTMPDMNRQRRIAFVITMVTDSLSKPYPPAYAFFTKGDDAEKLIIVSNQAGRLDTVYRARALLATMTSIARTMPIFREFQVQDWFTFLDLANMLGFKKVTLSDGDAFTHQVIVE